MSNNTLLQNATLAGFASAMFSNRFPTAVNGSAPPAIGVANVGYEDMADQAIVLAEAVDAAIPNDSGISDPTSGDDFGTALIASTSAATVQLAQVIRTLVLEGIVQSVLGSSYLGQPSGAFDRGGGQYSTEDLETITDAIAGTYALVSGGIGISADTPAGGSGTIKNQLFFNAAAAGALVGFFEGQTAGLSSGNFPDGSAVDEVPLTYATYFAYGVDQGIDTDTSISSASVPTNPLVPVGSDGAGNDIELGQIAKARLVYQLAYSATRGRLPSSLGIEDSAADLVAWGMAAGSPVAVAYAAIVAPLTVAASNLLNPLLADAAYVAFVASRLEEQPIVALNEDQTADDVYGALIGAGVAYSLAVNAAFGASDTATSTLPSGAELAACTAVVTDPAGNSAVIPSSSALTESALGKTALVAAVARAMNRGRSLTGDADVDDDGDTYVDQAASLSALSLVLFTELQTP